MWYYSGHSQWQMIILTEGNCCPILQSQLKGYIFVRHNREGTCKQNIIFRMFCQCLRNNILKPGKRKFVEDSRIGTMWNISSSLEQQLHWHNLPGLTILGLWSLLIALWKKAWTVSQSQCSQFNCSHSRSHFCPTLQLHADRAAPTQLVGTEMAE